jgi:hypothetical protein
MTQEKEAISKGPSGRVTRTPLGQRNLLTVKGKDPNYHYRIVNVSDSDDNFERRVSLGYEPVDNSIDVGDKRVSTPSTLGSVKHISVGQGQKAVVMRIKREWHEEDQAQLNARADEQEATIKQKALDGTYGKLEIGRG